LGVDIIDAHLELARSRFADFAPRLTFEHRSVFGLELEDSTFDLTVCRHVLHSIPHADRVLAELVRVTRPGGYLHRIPEDYGMLYFERGALDIADFWNVVPARFGAATGTDLHIGRHTFGLLVDLALEQISVDYVMVDTLRVPRAVGTWLRAWTEMLVLEDGELWVDRLAVVRDAYLTESRDTTVRTPLVPSASRTASPAAALDGTLPFNVTSPSCASTSIFAPRVSSSVARRPFTAASTESSSMRVPAAQAGRAVAGGRAHHVAPPAGAHRAPRAAVSGVRDPAGRTVSQVSGGSGIRIRSRLRIRRKGRR
jgi:Methyltransferase domain